MEQLIDKACGQLMERGWQLVGVNPVAEEKSLAAKLGRILGIEQRPSQAANVRDGVPRYRCIPLKTVQGQLLSNPPFIELNGGSDICWLTKLQFGEAVDGVKLLGLIEGSSCAGLTIMRTVPYEDFFSALSHIRPPAYNPPYVPEHFTKK